MSSNYWRSVDWGLVTWVCLAAVFMWRLHNSVETVDRQNEAIRALVAELRQCRGEP